MEPSGKSWCLSQYEVQSVSTNAEQQVPIIPASENSLTRSCSTSFDHPSHCHSLTLEMCNMSQELLLLETQVSPPDTQPPLQPQAQQPPVEGVLAGAEGQLQDLQGQVEQLQLLVETQAEEHDRLQTEFLVHLSKMRGLVTGQQHTAEQLSLAQSTAHQAVLGLHALQDMLVAAGGAADSTLSPLGQPCSPPPPMAPMAPALAPSQAPAGNHHQRASPPPAPPLPPPPPPSAPASAGTSEGGEEENGLHRLSRHLVGCLATVPAIAAAAQPGPSQPSVLQQCLAQCAWVSSQLSRVGLQLQAAQVSNSSVLSAATRGDQEVAGRGGQAGNTAR
ncbi:hypothetical protein V8C86DRAFT_1569640 [Haematococcus lacustris]